MSDPPVAEVLTGKGQRPTTGSGQRSVVALVIGIALVLLAFGLGVYRLGAAPVTWDEGFSVYAARLGVVDGAVRTAQDVHPPLYYWALGGWTFLSGFSEFAVRLPSVAATAVLVALLLRWGRELAGSWAGLSAGLTLTLSPLVLAWAQSARMYALGPLLAMVVLYAVWRLVRGGGRQWRWALGLAAGGAVFTHYVALVAWGAAALVLGLGALGSQGGIRRSRVYGLVALATPALALVAWLTWALPQRTLQPQHYSLFPLSLFFRLYPTALAVGQTAYIERYAAPATLTVAVAVLGAVSLAWRGSSFRAALAVVLAAILLGIPALLLTSYPDQTCSACAKFHAKHILFMVPPFALLVGVGVAAARRIWLPLGAATAVIVVWPLAVALPSYYPARDGASPYPPLTALLAARSEPGDGVLLYPDPEWPQYFYYALRAGAPTAWESIPTAGALTEQRVEAIMSRLRATYAVLWVVQSPSRDWADREGLVEQWLRQHGTLEPVGSSAGWSLFRFAFAG